MSQNLLVKYSLILTPQELKILHKDNIKNVDGIQTEQPKVLQKLMKSQLRPNERKKVVSKNTGKWLCMSDEHGIIGVILVSEDYTERLGYMFIDQTFKLLNKNFGEAYFKLQPDELNNEFKNAFHELLIKYNDPTKFDKMASATAKVGKAKDKMLNNLQFAMDNSNKLEGLNDKTSI